MDLETHRRFVPPEGWAGRYDKARIEGAKRAQALRDAVGVDEHGDPK